MFFNTAVNDVSFTASGPPDGPIIAVPSSVNKSPACEVEVILAVLLTLPGTAPTVTLNFTLYASLKFMVPPAVAVAPVPKKNFT